MAMELETRYQYSFESKFSGELGDIPKCNNLKKHQITISKSSSSNHNFQCNNPATPSMQTMTQRILSYSNWPHHIKATPIQMAEAGLFYLGTRDRVKCFNCNGGLQGWKYEEDPWYEHIKWYPNCEFVLKNKGMKFVKEIASRHPDLNRPKIKSTVSLDTIFASTLLCSDTARSTLSDNTTQDIKELQQPVKSFEDRVNAAMKSEIVKEASGYGFDLSLVTKVVEEKLLKYGEEYTSVLSLVEDLQAKERQQQELNSGPSALSSPSCSSSTSTTFLPNETKLPGTSVSVSSSINSKHQSKNENIRSGSHPAGLVVADDFDQSGSMTSKNLSSKKDSLSSKISVRRSIVSETTSECDADREQTCKVCLDKKINCLFTPCNHLACCLDCGSVLTKCPLCRAQLNRIIKIYR